ncbi:MAG: ABC transporter substrate-binding protein [Bacteroidales bacterium]|nr:ABC transporter substrate-binding protein [Bacteroidales bacterium]
MKINYIVIYREVKMRIGKYLFLSIIIIMGLLVSFNVLAVEKYKIGVPMPFTGDGAMYGEVAKEGLRIALNEINTRGNIEIELVYHDDEAIPANAAIVANRLSMDKDIIAVLGHFNSSCSLAGAPVYAEHNLVMLSPCSSALKLTRMGLNNVFRIIATDDILSKQMADFVWDRLDIKKAAVVCENSDFGRGLANGFIDQFEKRGGSISAFETYVPNVDKDFNPLITKFKATDAEILVVLGVYVEASLITRAAGNLGYKVPVIGGSGIYNPEFLEIATPEFAEGAISFTYFLTDYPDLETQRFIELYRTAYSKDPIDVPANYYDGIHAIARAIELGGTTREKLLEILPTIEFKGATGLIKFDENHDCSEKIIMKATVKDGNWVAIPD